MKILKVTVQNLNSLRIQQTIDFTSSPLADSGLFAITGDTGSGKTTILDALTLALYGKVHRNKEVTEVMTYGETESLAEVEFESKEGVFRVSWKIWRANKKVDGNLRGPERSLSKWDEKLEAFKIIAEKVREVDRGVENASGLDYDRFCRSVLLSQGDFAAFLKASEKERSELLERITGREIYTQLSKAAFDRNKEEKEKLDNLHQQKNNLNILDTEELKLLKAEVAEKKKASKTLKKELHNLQKKKQQHQKYFELLKKDEEKKGALAELKTARDEAQNDFERLANFAKIRTFLPSLSTLEQQQKIRSSSHVEIKKLSVALPTLKAEKEASTTSLSQQETSFKALKEDFKIQKPLLEEVKKLDFKIEEKAISLANRKADFSEQQKEVEMLQCRFQKHEIEQKLLDNQLIELSSWLEDNACFESLPTDLPKIELHRKDLRSIYVETKDAQKAVAESQTSLDEMTKRLQKIAKETAEEKSSLKKIKKTFDEAIPNKKLKNREAVIQFLYDDIEALGKVQNDLQQLHQINEQYEGLLKELSDWETQIEGFRNEELEISKQLMSSTEMLDVMSENVEFKQQMYEQQQLISNYEKDRAELKEGDPCPLCFSQKHPFRLKKITPYVDATKKELDQAQARRELVYKNHTVLIGRHNMLANEIEKLTGDSLKTGGQIARQVKKIEGFEHKMSAFAKTLDADLFAMSRSSLLAKKIADLQRQAQSKKKVLSKMQTLVKTLSEKERIVGAAVTAFEKLETEIKAKKASLEQLKKQLERLERRFETAQENINIVLKKYGCSFELKTAGEMFKKLEIEKDNFVKKQTERRQQNEKLSLLVSQLKDIESQLIAGTKKVALFDENLQKEQAGFDKICAKRKRLFGEKNAQETLIQFEHKIEESGLIVQKMKATVAEITDNLNSKEHLLADKEKQYETFEKATRLGEEKLLRELAKINIDSLADLRSKVLDESTAQAIEYRQKKLFEKETAVKQSLADIKTEKELLAVDIQEDVSVSVWGDDIRVLDDEYAKVEQEVGALDEKLKENKGRKELVKSLLKDINKQEKEHLRWARLNELIGQADGKKFRIFAQGLTLRKLVSLANIHLQNLNERYFIRKPNDQNLHLEIVDTFQADNSRSMLTLSGGESFLVSLALALGLSDLAGRKTEIKSLFIDEGFGSLDENTLDMALSTLENLRASGKTIGLISHVSTLKERIATQIKVHKSGNGFSQIEVTS